MQDLPDWTEIINNDISQAIFSPRSAFDFANDPDPVAPAAPPFSINNNTNWYGKMITRSARGIFVRCKVYCKHTGAGVISFGYTVFPGQPELGTFTVTPGVDWAWTTLPTLALPWPYDTLLVYTKNVPADCYIGYDQVEPTDSPFSTDSGVTWAHSGYRPWIRARFSEAAQGGVTVNGTVSAILLPNESVKYGGLWGVNEYVAKNALDKNAVIYPGAIGGAGVFQDLWDYTVPAGKTLYFSGVAFSIYNSMAFDDTHIMRGVVRLSNISTGLDILQFAFDTGEYYHFPKPIIFTTGQHARVYAMNESSIANTWAMSWWGYEI